ncbi:restriction endonuclease subunit S [Nonomuraea fuscirosea]|uniref:restriction endonuclease subunit S n=1 Tax=Nonomuraea fuscirosea TaxID=1291556 RepID=UPI0034268A33
MTEWCETTLDHLVRLQRGHDLPTGQRRPGIVPVVGAAGPSGLHDTAIAKAPGVVVGRAGASMGHATYCDVDFWPLNTSLYVTDFLGNDPRFVYYLLGQIDFSGFNSGAAQPMLNRNYIKQIPIIIPSLHEQREISATLGALDDKIAINERIAKTARDLGRSQGERMIHSHAGEVGLLRDYVSVIKGHSYKSSDLAEGLAYLVTLKCIDRTGVFQHRGLKPFVGSAKESQVVKHGEVVVAHTDLTQSADVLGRAARVVEPRDGKTLIASLDLAVVRPKHLLTPEYLEALLGMRDFREHSSAYSNGTTVLHLSGRAIPEFTFKVPDAAAVANVTAEAAKFFDTAVQAQRESWVLSELRDTLLPQLMSGRLRVRDAKKIVEDMT